MAFVDKLAQSFRRVLRADTGMARALLVIFVALATFTAALVGGFLHSTRTADEAIRAGERRLLENHLEVTLRGLMDTQAIQLTWDDAMRNAGQGEAINASWVDANFGGFLGDTVGASEMFLISPEGKLLRGWRKGQPVRPEVYDAFRREVRRSLAALAENAALSGRPVTYRALADTRWPFGADGRPLRRWHGSIIDHGGQPALMTVITLLPDGDYRLLRRTPNLIVTVRDVDASLLADLRFAHDAPSDSRRNALALVDSSGRELGWMSWRPHVVGPLLLARTAPLLVGYVLFYCIVLTIGVIAIREAIGVSRELAASEARAQHNALHDPLLGLPNRTHVMQRLTAMLANPTSEGEQVVLAYFDLDRFKAINESVGHHVGDDVLVQVVERLRRMMAPGDVLGRLASDEFVLVRRGADGRIAADELGAALMAVFSEPFSVFGQSVPVTASCGIS